MEGEIIRLRHSNTSPETLSILVVDDDTTCLSIVAAILKKWKYEVVTVKHPIDALCTLRIKGGSFDLVVSDVHMPDMNGFELQKQIDEEFKLPVVLMSADDKEGVILKGIENGAAFFIVKPISLEDVQDLWQYAATNSKKKGRAMLEEIESDRERFTAQKGANEDIGSSSSANKNRYIRKDSKRKDKADNGEDNLLDSATPKKTKVVWTNALHNRFLEAINSIGLERAVPKKILEVMKVPGLSRENVASHLQKYRIFLRQVSDASYRIQCSSTQKSLGNGSLLMLNKPRKQPLMKSSFHGRFGEHVPLVFNSSNNATMSFTNQASPSRNPNVPPSGYGQSRLLCNPGISSDFLSGTDSMQMYKLVLAQTTPESLNLTNTTTVGNFNNSNPTGFNSMEESNIFNGENGLMNIGIQNENMNITAANSFGNGGEDDYAFGAVNSNASAFDNSIYPQQAYEQDDLTSIFFNQFNIQSPHQEGGGEEIRDSNFCYLRTQSNDYFPWFDQNSNQQQGHGRSIDSRNNDATQFNNIHPGQGRVLPPERDDEEFLESIFCRGPYAEDHNIGRQL